MIVLTSPVYAEWLTGFPDTRTSVDFVMAEADRVLSSPDPRPDFEDPGNP